jgi:hypothetical protein
MKFQRVMVVSAALMVLYSGGKPAAWRVCGYRLPVYEVDVTTAFVIREVRRRSKLLSVIDRPPIVRAHGSFQAAHVARADNVRRLASSGRGVSDQVRSDCLHHLLELPILRLKRFWPDIRASESRFQINRLN